MRTAITRALLRAGPLFRSPPPASIGHRSRLRSRARRGFSIIELLVVLIVSGFVMAIGVPRFAAMRDRMALRSAKQQMAAYLVTARAAAIRRSSTAVFSVQNSTISARVKLPDGTQSSLGGKVPLLSARGVAVAPSISAADSLVAYDSRGMANLSSARVYLFTRNSKKDSICVSRLGLIAQYCSQ
ncbi:MAG TPA: type II secretion system protein [Gemmatimonadaceae bacterium]|jgi:prepilin-type N-terminal cleavage/methylation domain-containing protein|nr:type II secretion system protein [Gemmatimonadaceae bacterium]